ncbi:hypothetical protein F2P56_014028 [Juglans regia]|uniref:Uncharacterized protein LOC108995287 n=2 Tax=Juglans regia TaxID=51240 RepID=A0A2I4F3Y5_JUGRE|nr:uncharacterized protein LOC108995287 [Juglans regia]KAF5463901.1 hypothetical protein F2P56_014028 [Juglans regia]
MAAVEVPKWLTSILDANFHDPCKEHKDKENTHFCLDCNGKVLCKTCKTQSSMHAGHKVLQVYKASHRAVLRIQDIGLLFDISDIHPYSINSYSIVFLRPRIKEANHAKSCMMDLSTLAAHGCAKTEVISSSFTREKGNRFTVFASRDGDPPKLTQMLSS